MNKDTLNMEIREYLKKVGVTDFTTRDRTRILKAIESGKLNSIETLGAKMTINAPTIGLNYCIEGK